MSQPKLRFVRGRNYTVELTFASPGGAPLDLTDCRILYTAKPSNKIQDNDDATAVLRKDIASHTDAAAGRSQLLIVPADTAGLAPGHYYDDIVLIDSGGQRLSMREGQTEIVAEITRRE